MSFNVAKACKPIEIGRGARKAVLVKMADVSNKDGGAIFPSVGSLAKATKYSRRSVQYALKWLTENGLVKLIGERAVGRAHVNEYAIDLDKIVSFGGTQCATATADIPQIKGANSNYHESATEDVPQIKGAEIALQAEPISAGNPEIKCNMVDMQLEKGAKVAPKPIEDYTLPDGKAAGAAPVVASPGSDFDKDAPPDPSDVLWSLVGAVMTLTGFKERRARAMIAQWRNMSSAAIAVDAITAALTMDPPPDEPVSWIMKAVSKRRGNIINLPAKPVTNPDWRTWGFAEFEPLIKGWVKCGKQYWNPTLWGPAPYEVGSRVPRAVLRKHDPNYQTDIEDFAPVRGAAQ